MKGQSGGAPPATGQSERSMHVFPLARRSAALRAQLLIALTLKAVRQITRKERKKALIVATRLYFTFLKFLAASDLPQGLYQHMIPMNNHYHHS